MNFFWLERKTPILSASKLACLQDVATINLTTGCGHECIYCYARGYSSFPGAGKVGLYQNIPQRLQNELIRKRRLPRRVYFCPSCDLFQPIPEVQEVALETLKILFQAGVEVAFLTKGEIPEPHFQLLERYAPLCFAQIGLITVNDSIRSIFEPFAASVSTRLAQAKRLTAAKISTTVRLDPILPEVTDSAEDFEALCDATSHCGIRELAAGILFVRPGFASRMAEHFQRQNLSADISEKLNRLLFRFQKTEPLAIHAASSRIRALSLPQRLTIFTRLTETAARFSQTVHICTCKNPDLPASFFNSAILPKCEITGSDETPTSQLKLW